MKPERYIWEEDSTHRAVAGKEYDEVWDYAEQLEEEFAELDDAHNVTKLVLHELEAENEALKGHDDGTEKCMSCESMVEQTWRTEDDAWNKLSGYPDGNGLLCIRCFDRKAQEQGVYFYWACQPSSFPKIDTLLTGEDDEPKTN